MMSFHRTKHPSLGWKGERKRRLCYALISTKNVINKKKIWPNHPQLVALQQTRLQFWRLGYQGVLWLAEEVNFAIFLLEQHDIQTHLRVYSVAIKDRSHWEHPSQKHSIIEIEQIGSSFTSCDDKVTEIVKSCAGKCSSRWGCRVLSLGFQKCYETDLKAFFFIWHWCF